ncbi:hypothetical protein M427DRAFT_129812 [Gonapodya prolifera JEL478]|uniref:Uncharacterized protein n=1 Tax=Gonapodya prolifera (strain JEL478) TaxID=1344416 RepID=A0A139AZA1_GONPJ|nr:hypothetical protein M427DRAFT_129812 [Gonapodya prolifera JEL478]|eukprot:KXS22034.1 hypothetical protein M427DRAFT_129812 [Gonapodya prolifera JEL478]
MVSIALTVCTFSFSFPFWARVTSCRYFHSLTSPLPLRSLITSYDVVVLIESLLLVCSTPPVLVILWIFWIALMGAYSSVSACPVGISICSKLQATLAFGVFSFLGYTWAGLMAILDLF